MQQQMKSIRCRRRQMYYRSRGRGRRADRAESAVTSDAGSVSFPSDIHVFVDEHIYNQFGHPGVLPLPQERHLMNMIAEPYHIRRIPQSVHNKLSRRGDGRQQQRRKSLLQNSLPCAVAAASVNGGGGGDSGLDVGPGGDGSNVLMTHAGLVGGFNIDETYKYKVDRMTFRELLIREVRDWINAYRREWSETQHHQVDDDGYEDDQYDDMTTISCSASASDDDDETTRSSDEVASCVIDDSGDSGSGSSVSMPPSSLVVYNTTHRTAGGGGRRRDLIMSNILLSDTVSTSDCEV